MEIVYKYFIGCKSYIEVKIKYRELAKLHHPDRSTGNKQTFQELADEYAMLGEGDYYPIRNIEIKTTFTNGKEYYDYNMNQNTKHAKYPFTPEEAFQKEAVTNLNAEEIERSKTIDYFKKLRESDIIFDYIDGVVKQAKKDQLNKLWIYGEIQKKWDLSLDHFKYVTFVMGDKISIAKELFRKYQLNSVV